MGTARWLGTKKAQDGSLGRSEKHPQYRVRQETSTVEMSAVEAEIKLAKMAGDYYLRNTPNTLRESGTMH